jgi:maltose phosphorylase
MNIVYGFAGMRSDGDILSFSPSIPAAWNGYSFRIHYQKDVIEIEINKEGAWFHTVHGSEINVLIYGKPVMLTEKRTLVTIPEEWRG